MLHFSPAAPGLASFRKHRIPDGCVADIVTNLIALAYLPNIKLLTVLKVVSKRKESLRLDMILNLHLCSFLEIRIYIFRTFQVRPVIGSVSLDGFTIACRLTFISSRA